MPNIKDEDKMIFYFGFGTNKDIAMMQHMIGREDIKGEPGRLIGYEVCIQRTDQFRTDIPPTTPFAATPRSLIMKTWGPDFLMYVSRPNPTSIAHGTIWQITPEELELVRCWELVDYGAQEDAWGFAINSNGELKKVITQSFMKPTFDIDRVVEDEDYEPYIWDRQAMLDKADDIRLQYLERKAKGERF